MKLKSKQIIGVLLIVLGLIIKILLNHNFDYWALSLQVSIILFIIGCLFLVDIFLLKNIFIQKFKQRPKNVLISKILKFTTIILIFLSTLGFTKLGDYLNYQLRNYILQENYFLTNGKVIEIENSRISKLDTKSFYVLQEKFSNKQFKIPIDFVVQDKVNVIKKLIHYKNKTLTVRKIESLDVKFIYSAKYPSFVKIMND